MRLAPVFRLGLNRSRCASNTPSTKALLPKTLRTVQHTTQHCVKLIRWVADQLWIHIPWKKACAALTTLHTKL